MKMMLLVAVAWAYAAHASAKCLDPREYGRTVFGLSIQDASRRVSGSGFFYTVGAKAYGITNAHVLRAGNISRPGQCAQVKVAIPAYGSLNARACTVAIGTTSDYDLAALDLRFYRHVRVKGIIPNGMVPPAGADGVAIAYPGGRYTETQIRVVGLTYLNAAWMLGFRPETPLGPGASGGVVLSCDGTAMGVIAFGSAPVPNIAVGPEELYKFLSRLAGH